MNLFLIFALILATILLAIVLEKTLGSPILIAITFFAVYLLALAILFAAGIITNLAIGLIAVIILTIIAFITAVIVRFIRCICQNFLGDCCNLCPGEDVAGDEDENGHNSNCCCQNRGAISMLDDRYKCYTKKYKQL